MKRLLFLVNPYAGKGISKKKAESIKKYFCDHGYNATMRYTYPDFELIDDLNEYDLIVCCGGDGTLNGVVTNMMKQQCSCPVGFIPNGTVNDCAKSLGISKISELAAMSSIKGEKLSYDIGKFDDRYFVYVAAFGAFTDVSYVTPKYLKNMTGKAAYFIKGVGSVRSIKSHAVTIKYDGKVLSGNFAFGAITNTRSVAGGVFKYKKDVARLGDGLFEVLLIKKPKSPVDYRNTARAILKNKYDKNCMTIIQASDIEIIFEKDVSWTLDGEFGGMSKNIHVKNCKGAINFMVKKQKKIKEKTQQRKQVGFVVK